MFIKNSSGDASKIKKLCKGEEFMWCGATWKVIEAFRSDNTEMRRIRCSDGSDEVNTLTSLLREMEISKDYKPLNNKEEKEE